MTDESTAARVVSLGDGRREQFGWGRIEWLANHQFTPGAEMTLGHVVLEPEKSNPRHYHPNCHELLYVLEGAIEHDVGGETVKLSTGSLLHIPLGAPHQARNVGEDPAVLLVIYSSATRETVYIDTEVA